MAFLPSLQFLDKLKQSAIKGNEPSDHAQRVPHLFRLSWRKDHTHGRLRAAFQHVVALFVETRDDGVALLKGHHQGRQRNRVIAADFEKVNVRRKPDPRELLNLAQPLDPRAIPSVPMPAKYSARVSREFAMVVVGQRLPDALWQRLLNFRKLILLAVFFVV